MCGKRGFGKWSVIAFCSNTILIGILFSQTPNKKLTLQATYHNTRKVSNPTKGYYNNDSYISHNKPFITLYS